MVDDWFIACDEIRSQMLDANAAVEWTPPQYGKRMDDWLRNMDDWNISRKRYFGLPLPFYPCDCGQLNVIGSRAELEARATGGLEQLQELHRPWIDEVPIRCESCNEEVRRVTEVGDAWLDAGIVPFSTLGWENPVWVEHGNATGAAPASPVPTCPTTPTGRRGSRPTGSPRCASRSASGSTRSRSWRSTLTGRLPYRSVLTYEKLLDEHGREMHRSWGNSIPADEAFERMGADVMRWQFCEQNPSQNISFGYGPANEVKRRLLTLWNSASFLIDYANIEEFRPRWDDLATVPANAELRPLDRWLLARTQALVAGARPATRTMRRRGSRTRSSRSWTTSRTGTSAARARASGAATRRP